MNGVQRATKEIRMLKQQAKIELRARAKRLKAEGLPHSALLHRLGVSSSKLYSLLKGE